MNHRHLSLPGLVVTLLAGLFAGCGPSAPPPSAGQKAAPPTPVTVAPVQSVPWEKTVAIVGTLYAKDEASVSAEVEGSVERTLVDFGDRLTNGQLIAQIDTASYEALAAQAAANLTQAKAKADNATKTLARLQTLQTQKISSQSELDQATADAAQMEAGVKAAEAAQIVAQLNLDRSYVKAPFDSAVSTRSVGRGDFAKIASPLFQVVNDSVLKFIFYVPEKNAPEVVKRLPVRFQVDAYPGETFEGKVYLISPSVATGSRSFGVGALVTNTNFRLKANTYAHGEIVLQPDATALTIPVEAPITFAGITKVFVMEEGVAKSHVVQLGRIKAGRQEVISGVKAGETVIVTGQAKLFDGAKVALKTEQEKPAAAPEKPAHK